MKQSSTTQKREIQWHCPQCLRANGEKRDPPATGPWTCAHCAANQPSQPQALNAEGEIAACPVCSCPDLYRQRDFNRKLGVGIVLLGAALAPFTYYLSIIGCVLIDLAIYRFVPDIVVCYHCRAILRHFAGSAKIKPFDLNMSDKYIEIERRRGW